MFARRQQNTAGNAALEHKLLDVPRRHTNMREYKVTMQYHRSFLNIEAIGIYMTTDFFFCFL